MPFPSRPLARVVPPLCGLAVAYLRASISHRPSSDVEADVEDVAVVDDVGLALETLLARPRGFRVAARRYEVVPAHHLAADEAAGDVGMDRLRGVERSLAAPERPGPCLLLACGEEGDQVERLSKPAYDLAERGLTAAAELRGLLGRELAQLGLQLEIDSAATVYELELRLRRQRLELWR